MIRHTAQVGRSTCPVIFHRGAIESVFPKSRLVVQEIQLEQVFGFNVIELAQGAGASHRGHEL